MTTRSLGTKQSNSQLIHGRNGVHYCGTAFLWHDMTELLLLEHGRF